VDFGSFREILLATSVQPQINWVQNVQYTFHVIIQWYENFGDKSSIGFYLCFQLATLHPKPLDFIRQLTRWAWCFRQNIAIELQTKVSTSTRFISKILIFRLQENIHTNTMLCSVCLIQTQVNVNCNILQPMLLFHCNSMSYVKV